MTLCSLGHDQVCYETACCPACLAGVNPALLNACKVAYEAFENRLYFGGKRSGEGWMVEPMQVLKAAIRAVEVKP